MKLKKRPKGPFLNNQSHSLAGVRGVEPLTMVLETIVIPFNYTPE